MMNATQANAVPLPEIMEILALLPVKSNSIDLWYYSPFSAERTPSLHVDAIKNRWYDFGINRGGGVIDFICTWLEATHEDNAIVDALRWLENMHLKPSPIIYFPNYDANDEIPLVLCDAKPLQDPALIGYLDKRGVPFLLAKKHVKEILVRNTQTGRKFCAIGMRNEENGYALKNSFFNGSVEAKHISFVRGTRTSEGDIHVFENFMNFLSALVYQKNNHFEGDAIILNSLSCLSKALPYIETCPYKTLHTWFDNDTEGENATRAFNKFTRARGTLDFKPMNKTYAPHKDVNTWHMHRLGLLS